MAVTESDVPDHLVEAYISEGQDVIDNYLRLIYAVPFLSVPTSIKRICADIAAYFIMRDFPDRIFEQDLERLERTYTKDIQDLVNGNTTLPTDSLPTSSVGNFVYKVESDGSRWDDYNTGN
jgi:phage gp36-like protein